MYFCRSGVYVVGDATISLSRPVDRTLEVDKRLWAVCMGTSPIHNGGS